MIKVWVVCVVLFFGFAELYQWVDQWAEQIALPLPVYGVAGLLLALLSNHDRWRHLLFAPQFIQPSVTSAETALPLE